ncbi:MAG: methyltransferase domain-containing protein [Chloroflexi bacterium]|nr:methyltransferase domain-containing protein [Chloroflexota bacterium]
MNNASNLKIYRRFAPIYDHLMRSWTAVPRRKAIELLELKPGEQLLIPGVGTGLDLPYLPDGVCVIAMDLSPAMLKQARNKCQEPVGFSIMDGQALALPDGCFDAVLLNLILSVVPDGPTAMQEAWRILKPGGRAAIFDKFLPEGNRRLGLRRLAGWLIRQIGTDPNRRFREMIQNIPGALVLVDAPSLLNGLYRLILMTKPIDTVERGAHE